MKKFLALVMALCMIFSLCACGSHVNAAPTEAAAPAQPEAAAPETTGADENASPYLVETLKLAGGTDWGTPSPYLNVSRGPGQAKMRLVFASLLEKDENGDVPWLAESWSMDGLDYTFTLFEGLTFHDGEPLTTEDVAFSIDYFREHPPITNTLGTGDGFLVDSYNIIDERTITITVKKATADTLANLGGSVIIPKHIWENVEDPNSFTDPACLIGSGAYMSTAYEAATGSYEFTAFPGWVNGTPAAERVLFVPVSDELLAFENGEIDITSMPADLADQYMSDPSIGLVEKANDMGYKMLINFEVLPEYLDLELRQAIYAAIDRQSIVDNVFRGAGTVGSAGYVPVSSLFYNSEVKEYSYDPDAAKAVLGDKNLAVTILIDDGADTVNIAEIVKNGLEAAGMTITVEAVDSASRDARVNSGEYEFAIVGNGGWGNNPPNFMRTLFSDKSKYTGGNPHSMGPRGYSNETMTQIAEEQMFETDFNARIEMFKELQMLVSEEIPLFVLGNQSSYSMYHADYYSGWMKTYAYQQTEQNRLSFMAR